MPAEQKSETLPVYGYFGLLMALAILNEKLASTPLKFLYKDQLHLSAAQTATVVALITIPGYFAFAFGLLRDRFNPFKQGDRGYLQLGGVALGVLFFGLSRVPLSLPALLAGLFVISGVQTLIRAAYQALMRNIATARQMSGRISATYQFMTTALPLVATYMGGWLTDQSISWRWILVAVGLGYLSLGVFGRWKPSRLYDGLAEHAEETPHHFWLELKELARRRAFWIAAGIWGLWAFSPGANTPIYYYMTTTLKMSQSQYSLCDGLTTFTLVPTVLLFGALAKRFSLWSLVLVATFVAIPQMVPLMLIHNAGQAYAAATFMGLTGGLANAAFWTLVLRASPQNLAGTGMLMAISFGHLSVQGSDILGGWIFERSGFSGCAVVTTLAYLLLIPLVLLYPRELMRARDAEAVA